MITSMTGFARNEVKMKWGMAIWEIRTVNHRYLEITCRLPDGFRDLELTVRDVLRKSLSRGKVDVYLNLKLTNTAEKSTVNKTLVKQLLEACHSIRASSDKVDLINPTEILRWPGVLETKRVDVSRIKTQLLKGLRSTLKDLITVRQREGKTLAAFMQERLDKMQRYAKDIEARLPLAIKHQRSLLNSRFSELKQELDHDRLEQEMVMFAHKVDVAEELHRLSTHVTEVGRVLKIKGSSGRRLDFLMQELNRETNTLAAKSVDAIITKDTVELKVLIEQMREQVQNIE